MSRSLHVIRRLRFSKRFSLEHFAYNHPYLFSTRSFDEHSNPQKHIESSCSHPIIYQGKCTHCEEEVGSEYGLGFGFLHQGLQISFDEADRMRGRETQMFSGMGKLHLVLDLDHTLLHTVPTSKLLDPIGNYFNSMVDDDEVFSSKKKSFTRLRPFVRTFLKKAHRLFHMTIYTMGERSYALRMAKLLDPNGVYFGDRIISREYCTTKHQKNLDVVLAKKSNILILDDTAVAWPNNQDNLILIEPYNYYIEACKKELPRRSQIQNVLLEANKGLVDNALPRILKVLKEIHRAFFNSREQPRHRDVRKLLQILKNTPY